MVFLKWKVKYLKYTNTIYTYVYIMNYTNTFDEVLGDSDILIIINHYFH